MNSRESTNWTKCCLCQQVSSKDLRHPYRQQCYHEAYNTLESDIKHFKESNIPLPLGVTLEALDDGSGIANTLLKNNAKYHSGCRLNFTPNMLQRQIDKIGDSTGSKRGNTEENSTVSPKKTRSSFSASLDRETPQCVYCQKYEEGTLHEVESMPCGENLLQWATEAKNWEVLARLKSALDARAGDIYYHRTCYTELKNAARASSFKTTDKSSIQLPFDPIVIAHLVAFVKNAMVPQKLSDLRKLYGQRLQAVDSDWKDSSIHSTRFKEHMVQKLGANWHAFNKGKEVFISHIEAVGAALAESARCQSMTEDEAEKIIDVSLLLRKHILEDQTPFDGSFDGHCLSKPVPEPLLTLIDVLLEGTSSIAEQDDKENLQARTKVACTISQLVISNASKRKSKNTASLYQRKQRETPLPLYVGLKLHVDDRQKTNINTFHTLGMSVSYERVMEVRKEFAQAVSERWNEDEVVVPTNIKRGVFVTSAVDNIDQSGRVEFHGTALTLTSHATHDNLGEEPPSLRLELSEKVNIQLPDDFVNVPNIDEFAGDIKLTPTDTGPHRPTLQTEGEDESAWLKHLESVIENESELQEIPVTYSGFFSHHQQDDVRPSATFGVFPTFYEKAACINL